MSPVFKGANLEDDTKERVGKSPPRSLTKAQISRKLGGLFRTIGMLVSMRDEFDGHVIAEHSDTLADAYGDIIHKHPKLHRFFTIADVAEGYGAAILATLAVAVPILDHHGKLPPVVKSILNNGGIDEPEPDPEPPVDIRPNLSVA